MGLHNSMEHPMDLQYTIITVAIILVIAASVITTLVITGNPLALLGLLTLLIIPTPPQQLPFSPDMFEALAEQPEVDEDDGESHIGFTAKLR